MFNRTILLQNLLQLTGSVKSQNQSRGHVVILAIRSSSILDDLPCLFFSRGSDLDEFANECATRFIFKDQNVDQVEDDRSVNLSEDYESEN